MYRYTRVLKGALFALLFSLSALLPSYAAITADGPGSGVAGPRETVPEEGAQTEALWQDPASPHPLEMEVVYGYDNTARSGRILPDDHPGYKFYKGGLYGNASGCNS